jgi:dipeptidyl aminopeptidase/acylaminoacyl peptidase
MAAEFGRAQWRLGLSTYAFVDANTIVCGYADRGLGRLAKLHVPSRRLTSLDLPYTECASIRANGDRVLFCAGTPAAPDAIVLLQLSTGEAEVLKTAFALSDEDGLRRYFSAPRPVEFPTSGGKTAHAPYYPPDNPDYRPLVVRCHGGPTSAASSALNLSIQYWTSRGIAVLDVNYGGSTGYGRDYRNRLYRSWGVVDVDDCVNGALWLSAQGLADSARMVIMGGSAGGYTALAALAFREGGASHYGVSDLSALARDTHKFESRYLDWLIGPYPAERDLYRARSPVYAAAKIKAPVIFFQGSEDKIVPPSQTDVMVAALRKNGITAGSLLFSGEQHGFRRGADIKRALDAALYFLASQVFRTALTL